MSERPFENLETKKGNNPDIYLVIRSTVAELFDDLVGSQFFINRALVQTGRKQINLQWLSDMAAFEAVVLYYAFLSWKRVHRPENTFTYHKKSGKVILFGLAIFVVAAETIVLHILIAGWNETVAWIITIPSAYVLLQIFAHIKAIYQRPIELREDKLIVRYGLLGDTEIDTNNIEEIEFTSIYTENLENVKNVSVLGAFEQFNTVIHLKEEEMFIGFYGMRNKYKTLLLYVDENQKLKKLIKSYESN